MTKADNSRPGYDQAVDRLVAILDEATDEQHRLAEIRREAHGVKRGDSPEQRGRLAAAIERFETDHPTLSKAIGDVAYYLSGSGV